MAVRHHGNRGKAWAYHGRAGNGGIGITSQIAGLGWTGLTGQAGDIDWLRFDSVCPVVPNLGLAVQASGAVKLQFTLSDPALATNQDPDVQATVLWGNEMTLTPKQIEEIAFPFTAVRVEFVAAAELYFASR